MRRALRKAEGRLRFAHLDRPDAEALRRFVGLEIAGWKGRGDSAIGSSEWRRREFDALVAAAAGAGRFLFHQLELEGRLIAAQWGVVCGGRFSMLKIAHDEQYRPLAPGHLLTYFAIEDCARRGLSEYDVIAADDEWKRKWTPHRRIHEHQFIFRRGLYGRLVRLVKLRINPEMRRMLQRPHVPRPANA